MNTADCMLRLVINNVYCLLAPDCVSPILRPAEISSNNQQKYFCLSLVQQGRIIQSYRGNDDEWKYLNQSKSVTWWQGWWILRANIRRIWFNFQHHLWSSDLRRERSVCNQAGNYLLIQTWCSTGWVTKTCLYFSVHIQLL